MRVPLRFTALFISISLIATIVNSSLHAQDDAAARKGKIAVLPFEYISNDNAISPEQMGTQVQSACANSLREQASKLDVQDPMTTNALLGRNNVDASNMKTFLPNEIAELLGVEYIVYGTFSLINKGTVTTGSAVTTYKDEDKKKSDEAGTKKENKGSAVTTTSSSSYDNYDATVDVNIYNDQGSNVYSMSKKPFSAGLDSYNGSLDYILKRSPWGSKAGKK